jgi:glucans biosynthesis protein
MHHCQYLRGIGLALFLALVAGAAAVERLTVDHDYVVSLAEKLTSHAYSAPKSVPKFFREINYDTYRRITFQPEATLWRDAGVRFQLQFNHPGYLFTQMVRLNEFSDTHTQPIPFAPNFFNYHDLDVPLLSRRGLDFAGFRILHPVNQPEKWDEIVSFLGASYFRALGRNQLYGISARGLALNAGGPDKEEFPAFIEFWIRKPEPNAGSVTIHALMDSPTVAGAYTFIVTPGDETIVETRATVIFRHEAPNAGFIPLSSMFWFGEGTAERSGDFRPEVHDSDGLLLAPEPGVRLWRPLLNPTGILRTDYDAPAFAGFGLLQRDRDFRSYEDFEANYERRPGVWTEPIGTWPAGYVRLVEMPTTGEYHDNVTAFWSPRERIPARRKFELAWKQHWSFAPTFGGPPGWVSATRQTVHDGAPNRTKYVIDFNAASLASVPADAVLTPEVRVSPGAQVSHVQVFRHPVTGTRRLILVLEALNTTPVDVRARLLRDRQPVTETWTTRWQP